MDKPAMLMGKTARGLDARCFSTSDRLVLLGGSERRLADARHPRGAGAQILIHDRSCRVFTAAAAAGYGQLILHVKERRSTAINRLADVFIGHGMANADVHSVPLAPLGDDSRTSVALIVNRNENDCQLRRAIPSALAEML